MGLFTRSAPALPPLPQMPPVKQLPVPVHDDAVRYLGTLDGERRVRARGLGSSGPARIRLSTEGVDVVRLAGSFRIPAAALRSARESVEFAGRTLPAPDVLVLRWEHGGSTLDTGFRLESTHADEQHRWTRSVHKIVRSHVG